MTQAEESNMAVSLANTFEYFPDYLVRIVEEVNSPNLKVSMDVGHFLVYSTIQMESWLKKVRNHTSCVYVHSNYGEIDTHEAPYEGLLMEKRIS